MLASQYLQMTFAFVLALLAVDEHGQDLAHLPAVVSHRQRAVVQRAGVRRRSAAAVKPRRAERQRMELDASSIWRAHRPGAGADWR